MIFDRPVFRMLTFVSGAIAVLFVGLATTSYRFSWKIGGQETVGSKPRPMWGCAFEDGYVYVRRVTEKQIDGVVGDSIVFSVPTNRVRSFHSLFGSELDKSIWIVDATVGPNGPTEIRHYTNWVSLWLLGGAFAVLPLTRWSRSMLRQRALRSGQLCATCRYWLIGNESGICPECGTPVPAAQRAILDLAGAKIKLTDTRP